MDEKMKSLIADIVAWLTEQRRHGVRFISLETLTCEFIGADVTEIDVHHAYCHLINAYETLIGEHA